MDPASKRQANRDHERRYHAVELRLTGIRSVPRIQVSNPAVGRAARAVAAAAAVAAAVSVACDDSGSHVVGEECGGS